MPVKNSSDNACTLKTMLESMPSDNWAIDRCTQYCVYDGTSVLQEKLILDKYFYYFESKLIEIELNPKYYYKPQLFAYDYYGTAELDFMVLYFAGMKSVFDFNKPVIKVFPYSNIKEINQLFTAYRKTVDDSKMNPAEYNTSDINSIKTPFKYIDDLSK